MSTEVSVEQLQRNGKLNKDVAMAHAIRSEHGMDAATAAHEVNDVWSTAFWCVLREWLDLSSASPKRGPPLPRNTNMDDGVEDRDNWKPRLRTDGFFAGTATQAMQRLRRFAARHLHTRLRPTTARSSIPLLSPARLATQTKRKAPRVYSPEELPRNNDGTFKRPRGAPPGGHVWDTRTGAWVRRSRTKSSPMRSSTPRSSFPRHRHCTTLARTSETLAPYKPNLEAMRPVIKHSKKAKGVNTPNHSSTVYTDAVIKAMSNVEISEILKNSKDQTL
mmetsp:Transcript_10742/g.35256  ORF Transcript_10742/g.35256 Transcript_10742/m.35256 type:complete len:276 (-) Transcript_10742:263-1090(-)